MSKSLGYIILLCFAAASVAVISSHPEWVGDNNSFLKNFVNHEFLNLLGVILAITLASVAQIHFQFNQIEERAGKRGLTKSRANLSKNAYYLIGSALCIKRRRVALALLLLVAVVPVWAISPSPSANRFIGLALPIEAKPALFLFPHSLIDRAPFKTEDFQTGFNAADFTHNLSVKNEVIRDCFGRIYDNSSLNFINFLACFFSNTPKGRNGSIREYCVCLELSIMSDHFSRITPKVPKPNYSFGNLPFVNLGWNGYINVANSSSLSGLKSILGYIVGVVRNYDGLPSQDILPNHYEASYETDNHQQTSEKRHPVSFWLWLSGAAIMLLVSARICIAGVDNWKNRRDCRAAIFLSLGAATCWGALGILAWLTWP